MRLLECCGNLVHLRLGLFHRDARLQPRDRLKIDAHPLRIPYSLVGWDDVWHPEIGRTCRADGIGEIRRHDTDDLVRPSFERNRASDDRRIRAEAPPPESVAQNRDAVTAVDFLVGCRPASKRGLHSKHLEEVRRDPLRAQIFWLGARLAKGDRAAGDGRNRLEDLLLGRPIHVVLGCGARELERIAVRIDRYSRDRTSPRLVALPHRDQAIVLIERQPAKHHSVDHGKDRRAGADAEHEDQ